MSKSGFARCVSVVVWMGLVLGGVAPGSAGAQERPRKLSFDSLRAFIEKRNQSADSKQHLRSVPELMQALQAGQMATLSEQDRRILFLNWVGIFRSNSLQAATPENPRIAMRSSDGRFLMAYAGHGPTSHAVEIIQLDEATKQWEFAEIEFPASAPSTRYAEDSSTQGVRFIRHGRGGNAAACAGCHMGRPNWHSYRIWPGAFKGNDDFSSQGSLENTHREAFIRKIEQGTDPAYSFLSTSWFRVQGPPTTNTNFTMPVAKANLERIARILAESKDFSRYQYALMAAVLGCADIESFIPANARSRHPVSYRELLADTEQAHTAYYNARLQALGDNRRALNRDGSIGEIRDIEGVQASRIAALRYLAQALGLDEVGKRVEDWSMAPLNGKAFAFQAGYFGIDLLSIPLAKEITARRTGDAAFLKEMRALAQASSSALGGYSDSEQLERFSGEGAGCRMLRQRGLRKLATQPRAN